MQNFPSIKDLKMAGPAGLILACVLAGYMLLETARDALFLANMSATRLPWVYLVIAAIALVISQFERLVKSRASGRVSLTATLLMAAGGTGCFWWVGVSRSSWLLGSLYVWTGVLITVVMLQFWSLLAQRFTVSSAKRLFPLVAAGSTIGALIGSGAATAITRLASDSTLLVCASGAFVLAAAVVPFIPGEEAAEKPVKPGRRDSYGDMIRDVARSRYAVQVGTVLVIGAMALTVLDYVFKAAVTEQMDAADLGSFFAKYYLYLNLASVAVQLLLARWLVDRLGVIWTALFLPAVLFFGALGAVAVGSFTVVSAMKAVDGTVRHSLHRTTQELMFVPMPDRIRQVLKPLADTLGHRGGQATASVLLLVMAQFGFEWRAASLVLGALALAWLFQLVRLRSSYIGVFRESLTSLTGAGSLDFADLGGASVEELVAALDSPDDRTVLAALHILDREERWRLVPSLMVHHPSSVVVERSLAMYVKEGSDRFVSAARRELRLATPLIQAALVRAMALIDIPSESFTEWAEDDQVWGAQLMSIGVLNRHGSLTDDSAHESLEQIYQSNSQDSRALSVLADALAFVSDEVAVRWLSIFESAHTDARRRWVRSLSGRRHPKLIAALIDAHGVPELRSTARSTLLQHPDALAEARDALLDDSFSQLVRWELPETLRQLAHPASIGVLSDVLTTSHDGMMRYRVLRALEGIVEDKPELLGGLGERFVPVLDEEIDDGLKLLRTQLLLETYAPQTPTVEHELLCGLLHDKRVNTTERVVRLVGLGAPRVRVDRVFLGLRSDDGRLLSAAQELLTADTPNRVRAQVLALIQQGDTDERLAAVEATLTDVSPVESYEQALALALSDTSEDVASLAAATAAENGLSGLLGAIDAVSQRVQEPLLADAVHKAHARLAQGAA